MRFLGTRPKTVENLRQNVSKTLRVAALEAGMAPATVEETFRIRAILAEAEDRITNPTVGKFVPFVKRIETDEREIRMVFAVGNEAEYTVRIYKALAYNLEEMERMLVP